MSAEDLLCLSLASLTVCLKLIPMKYLQGATQIRFSVPPFSRQHPPAVQSGGRGQCGGAVQR